MLAATKLAPSSLPAAPSSESTNPAATGHPASQCMLSAVKKHWVEDSNGLFYTEWKIITFAKNWSSIAPVTPSPSTFTCSFLSQKFDSKFVPATFNL